MEPKVLVSGGSGHSADQENTENRQDDHMYRAVSGGSGQSADQENTENRQDDHMYRAVSRFISTREQSYDEFLNGFTYLSKGDVCMQKDGKHCEQEVKDNLVAVEIQASLNQTERQTVDEVDDDIEAEVLDEGSLQSALASQSGSVRKAMVKFDNFVDDVDDVIDTEDREDPEIRDLLGDSGYTASFQVSGSRETTIAIATKSDLSGVDETKPSSLHPDIIQTKTNFGEIEPEDCSFQTSLPGNQTFLEIRTTSKQPEHIKAVLSETAPEQVTSDMVETFQLDPDFDYDNVHLTPKFSEEDLHVIMASMFTGQNVSTVTTP